MTAFVAFATVLVIIALGWLLWPLLRTQRQSTVERDVANASIYRDQFADLDADLRRGTLSEAQYAEAKGELERRLLDEGRAEHKVPVATAKASRTTAVVVAVARAARRGSLLEARFAGGVFADRDARRFCAPAQPRAGEPDGRAAGRATAEGAGQCRRVGHSGAQLLHDAALPRSCSSL